MPTTPSRKGAEAHVCPIIMSGTQKPQTAIDTLAKLRFIFLLLKMELLLLGRTRAYHFA